MDFIYHLSTFAIFGIIVAGIIGLIKPSLFKNSLKGFARRKHIFIGSIAAVFALTGVATATEPAYIKEARNNDETAVLQATETAEEPEPVVETKTITETEIIKFKTVEKDDDTLESGETKVTREGKDGEKTLTYEVTYTDGVETSRELKSEEVTTKPVNKIVVNGTYVAPAPTRSSPPSTSSSGVVKKSTTGICHAPGTTYYDRTKNFTPYPNIQACLDSGGRLPRR
jgi:hypothetical protein